MPDIPTYPPLKKPDENDAVARSIANPNAFSKPGTMAKPGSRAVRVRAMVATKRPPGMRKRRKDLRNVKFY